MCSLSASYISCSTQHNTVFIRLLYRGEHARVFGAVRVAALSSTRDLTAGSQRACRNSRNCHYIHSRRIYFVLASHSRDLDIDHPDVERGANDNHKGRWCENNGEDYPWAHRNNREDNYICFLDEL